MAFWNILFVIVVFGLVFEVSQGGLPHTTCKRTYDKVGGFVEDINQRALPTILLSDRDGTSDVNDGHTIDWNQWSESVHSLACRCAAKTREKGWKVFGIQFFGECWSGANAHNDYNKHGPGSPTFQFLGSPPKPCNKSLDHECVGGEFVNYIYRLQDLDVNGGYTSWSNWSSCSKSCGSGTKSRDRTCTNPVPSGNGKDCQDLAPNTETVACNTHSCPTVSVDVDGGWSSWSYWTKCSVTCGGGTQVRSRTCDHPKPSGNGKKCQGEFQEKRQCYEIPCLPACNNPMDISIILDGSGSVQQGNFKKALDFLEKLVSYYRVSPSETHFGLITYSDNPTMEFTMADKLYHHHTALKQRIQSVKYPDGMTHTDRAMLLAGLALFTPYGGDRPGRSNALVVFTDGKTSDDSRPYPEVLMPLQAKGVRTIAVGIGPEVDHEELLEIAMGDPNYVVHATTYDTLKDKLDSIRDESCRVQAPPLPSPECHRFDPLGMSNGDVPAPSITASSQFSKNDGPELARLNLKKVGKYAGAWTAKYDNMEQWLQVHFRHAVKMIRVVTQGQEETNHHVKSYWMSYSQDGEYFVPYTYQDKIMTFKGNTDGSSEVGNNLPKPLYTRYVRIHPQSWSGRISMRVEFYGCKSGFSVPPISQCYKRLGMMTGYIQDSHIDASSRYSKATSAQNSRLYLHSLADRIGGWRPKTNDLNQWIEVDLGPITKVNIIATQGEQGADRWVESFSVSSSSDAVFWDFYRQRGRTTIFSGNVNSYSVVNQPLRPPIYARHIRIHPVKWHGAIAIRLEFYGCRMGFDVPPGPKCIDELGVMTGSIPNAHITATSFKNQQSQPFLARLRLPAGAWSPKTNDVGQWLQINIDKVAKVTRIATQGSFHADEWVTSYGVEYSRDGGHFHRYSQALRGNRDRSSIVGHIFYPALYAKYVRIRPRKWHGAIAIRLAIYGCRSGFTPPPPESCMKPLGIENKQISDSQLSASSQLSLSTGPSQARLHLHSSQGKAGAWVAKATKDQWFGVDFYDTVQVTRMSIQGREDADQWVSSFILKYSNDGYMFETYKLNGKEKVFVGNKDRYTVVSHALNSPIAARFIRVYPRTWHGAIALRLDYYGCTSEFVRPTKLPCTDPVGLENQKIPDAALSASSSWNSATTGPQWGRLNTQGPQGGAWVSRINDKKQWFQVDLGGSSNVTRCATQGRYNTDEWVTTYILEYSSDGKTFITYQNHGVDKLFQGNSDRNTVVVNVFDPPIFNARYIRIVPQEWHNHIALRVELFGCKGELPKPTNGGSSCSNAIDLGVAVDSSSDISLPDFQAVQTFLRRLVDKLHVSLDGNRMGIIVYNDRYIPMVTFADKGSQESSRMKTAISHIPYMFGGTRTDKALDFANHYFFSPSSGDRADKANVLLVLTNGKKGSNAVPYSTVLAPLLRKNVKVIAVGVGSQPDNKELLAITGHHQSRVVHMSNFARLYQLLGNVPQGSCEPPTLAPPSPRCPVGWISYKSHCYFFDHGNQGNNWYYSRSICSSRAKGGYLVDIRDLNEWDFVKKHLQRGKQYFIGMRDEPLESWWMWQDGGIARFFKWAMGEPNGGTRENCAVIMSSGLCNDIPCQSHHSNYICKVKMMPI